MGYLDEVRKEIDEIDEKLLPLIVKRMDAAKKVAAIKKEHNIPVLNSQREEEILKEMGEKGGEYASAVKIAYSTFMDISRALQHEILGSGEALRKEITAGCSEKGAENPRVICQGTEGAYSAKAAEMFFGDASEYDRFFCKSFEEIFSSVASGEADFGVVPVENSTAGSVHENFDLIMKYRLYIAGAVDLPVCHCLCAAEGAELDTISDVISHPQGLMQCKEFTESHGFNTISAENTAFAAERVSQSGRTDIAAICSEEAAKKFGLKILKKNIQSIPHNTTRFLIISKKLIIPENAHKISLIFSLPHVTGSLYRILGRFAVCGLNLTKLESRPVKSSGFSYLFYLDFTGSVRDNETLNLLCALYDELPEFTFLGNFRETENEN